MKILYYLLCPFVFIGCNTDPTYNDEARASEPDIEKEICKSKQEILLKSLDKNIYFKENICLENSQSESVTKYQLKNKNSLLTFDKKYNEGGNPPNNEAISLYQSKIMVLYYYP